jgi:hypothetical protein
MIIEIVEQAGTLKEDVIFRCGRVLGEVLGKVDLGVINKL